MTAKNKKYIAFLIKLCVTVFLVYFLFKTGRLTAETFAKLLRIGSVPFLAAAAFAFLLAQALSALRIVFLLRTVDIALTFTQAFRLTMIGNFFNIVIPGMVGGDIVKGYYLAKFEEDRKGRSSGIIIVDRVVGLFALLIIGGFSVLYLAQGNSEIFKLYGYELRIIGALSIAMFCAFAAFIGFGKNKKFRNRVKDIALRTLRQSFFYNIVEGLGAVAKKRRYLIYAFSASVFIQVISLTGLIVLVNLSGNQQAGIITVMAASSLVLLGGIIPVTPGNVGWTEFLASFGWSAVGADSGAETFLYWRIVTMVCALPYGLYLFGHQSSGKINTGESADNAR